jgi:tRNA (guanine10-N2)-dimethyltransferase
VATDVTPSTTVGWVELSGENPALAEAELAGAIEALQGRWPREFEAVAPGAGLRAVEVPDADSLSRLAGRLALARRVLRAFPESTEPTLSARLRREGLTGRSASFRPLAGRRGTLASPTALRLAAAYGAGGGSIDLERPDRRFWVEVAPDGSIRAFEELGAVDRAGFDARRMPRLPYQRPVSLAPRLGRVAANLASVRTGDPVIDPFMGTGALLLEAALLGARVSGVDRSPEMVRGALRNLARFGVDPERITVADAGETFRPGAPDGWSAVLTDPPYGRASGTAGEPPEVLIGRVLPRWADHVRPGGKVVVVLPGGPDPLPAPWVRTLCVPDRVHRSLTREFRVYRRKDEVPTS